MEDKMIKEWRASHNVSQVKLAEMLGVTLRTVSRWESEGYKSRLLELALKGLEAPKPVPAPTPAPRASSPSPYNKWEQPKLGKSEYGHQLCMNPGDDEPWVSLMDIAGMTTDEWIKHSKDESTLLGVLKAAARMYPRKWDGEYQKALKRANKKDEDVIDYCK